MGNRIMCMHHVELFISRHLGDFCCKSKRVKRALEHRILHRLDLVVADVFRERPEPEGCRTVDKVHDMTPPGKSLAQLGRNRAAPPVRMVTGNAYFHNQKLN